MSNTPYQDEEYAYTTAAINHLLVMAGCPNKFRQYIDCLIGLVNRAIKFEASDKQVATFARGRVAGGKIHAEKDWAKDKRTDLMKWQDEGNLEIVKIEVQPYDSKLRMRPPTKSTLNILRCGCEYLFILLTLKVRCSVCSGRGRERVEEYIYPHTDR